MVPQQAATMRATDLLIAIAFAEYTPAVVEVVRDAHIRGIPTLAITDVPTSPLARHSTVYFCVDDADIHRFRPIAGSMTLAQSLIIGLRSEEHTSELQSLMRISYAVFALKNKIKNKYSN